MRKKIFLFLLFVSVFVSKEMLGQDLQPTDKEGVYKSVKHPVYFDVSPPLSKMIKEAKPIIVNKEEGERREELIEEAYEKFIKSKMKGKTENTPDVLSKLQEQYVSNSPKSETITSIANFDGVTNLDGVAPPDTHGDVSPDYYMQCVNNHTAIYNRTGGVVASPFPTSNFWQGTAYDDRNDGDAVILWDEDANRWLVTQFYVPSSGTQYILMAVSTSSNPTGSYNRYAFSYTYMPDYPKFAIWHDGYYMGANAFNSSSNFQGAYISAFDRDAMIAGDASPTNVTILDANEWSLFPTDADALPSASIGGCFFMNDELNYTGNTEVYLKQYNVNWGTSSGTLSNVATLSVASYDLFNSGTEIPQNGTSQKLDLLHYRIMYRPYYKHFSDHDALLMTRTVNDGGTAAVRWYEFRNSGSGWSVYQQGTYNPGDGLWRWMSSIAMNDNGDIALGYSVSSSSTYPSIHCVARYANDPINVMTTNEHIAYTGTAAQTGASRWGDYSMVSVDPSDNTSFWFTTEYTTGSWNWKTKIVHFSLPTPCTGPTTQASNFSATAIGDNQMTVNWTRGNGNNVLVLAHEGSAVDANPVNGTNYSDNTIFGSGDELGTGNFVVYDGTGTSVTVTGLTAGTQYYFSVYEYFTADDCYATPGLTGNAQTTGTAPATYCDAAGGSSGSYEYIDQVDFGSISNGPTGEEAGFYGDYTSLYTNVSPGDVVSVTITEGSGYSSDKARVWIDWNQDGDFEDTNELAFESSIGAGPHSGSITVPATAINGATRMRVRVWDTNSEATGVNGASCGTEKWGEVEDYTVNVIGSTPVATVSATPGCSNSGSVTVSSDLSGTQTFYLRNNSGGAIFDWTGDATSHEFIGLTNGTYKGQVQKGTETSALSSAVTLTNILDPTAPSSVSATNTTICDGSSTTLSYSGGSGDTFTWYEGACLGGTAGTGNNVTVNPSITTTYYGSWSNTCGTSACKSVEITVNQATSITTQPSGVTECEGANVTFSVVASNATGYQWKKGGGNISGATSDTYTINGIATGDAGNYTCEVSGTCGNVTSNTATLVVNANTTITSQPSGVTECEGVNVTFTVVASNATAYQWKKGGSNISGTTSDTYTINGIATGDAGDYTCEVSGTCGNETSDAATLVVNANTAITAQPQNVNATVGDNVSFSVTADNATAYQWSYSGSSITGADQDTYSINNVQTSDAGNYSVEVSGICGNVTSDIAVLSVSVSIEDLEAYGIKIYPNPSNGKFNIELAKSLNDANISISNMTGKNIYSKNISSSSKHEIDLRSYSKGVYFIQFNIEGKTLVSKIVIK